MAIDSPSFKSNRITLDGVAPNAERIPISGTRCVTEYETTP